VSAAAPVAICFGFDLFVSENPGRADQRGRVVMKLQGGCPGGRGGRGSCHAVIVAWEITHGKRTARGRPRPIATGRGRRVRDLDPNRTFDNATPRTDVGQRDGAAAS
jgi:hypothetical protein